MHAIRDATDGAVPKLLKRLLYEDERRGIADLFHVVRIASGCGLFFKGRYFGQLNVAKEQVDEGAMVAELSGKLGSAEKIRGTTVYYRTSGSAHNVYRFDAGDTTAFLVYWEDAAATMYLSSRALAENGDRDLDRDRRAHYSGQGERHEAAHGKYQARRQRPVAAGVHRGRVWGGYAGPSILFGVLREPRS